jgi:choline-sulfatase
VAEPVSLVDLLPTFLELSGDSHLSDPADAMDGASLVPALRGEGGPRDRAIISEFLGEGSIAPCFMVREGRYKYIYSEPDPPQLFNLERDPKELDNLAGDPSAGELVAALHARIREQQDPAQLARRVLASQKRRRLVFKAHMTGRRTPWDYSPVRDASSQYMRNHLDLNVVESRARIRSRRL